MKLPLAGDPCRSFNSVIANIDAFRCNRRMPASDTAFNELLLGTHQIATRPISINNF